MEGTWHLSCVWCRAGHGLEMGQGLAGRSAGTLGVSPLCRESLAHAGVTVGQEETQEGPSIPIAVRTQPGQGCPELMVLGEAAGVRHEKEAMETNCDML